MEPDGDGLPIRDYNGAGEWSAAAVALRYERYCAHFGWSAQRVLEARTFSNGEGRWIYPIMDAVNCGIREDDPGCTEIGIDFICESASFPFGMTLKSNTTRALRKATLTERQEDRIRKRVARMLIEAYLPQEYRFYARLLRRTGLGQHREALLDLVPRGHRMAKYVAYVQLLAKEGY